MNWVDEVMESIPDWSKDIKLNLDSVINRSVLSIEDTHAVALSAALASGNGPLAHLIQIDETFSNFVHEADAAKTASSLMAMNNVWHLYVEMTGDPELKGSSSGLGMTAYANYGGVSQKKFEMYALAASIIEKCHSCVKNHYDVLKQEGVTVQELQHVGKITSVINAISKIAPPIMP